MVEVSSTTSTRRPSIDGPSMRCCRPCALPALRTTNASCRLAGGGAGVQHRGRDRVGAQGQPADGVEVEVGDQVAHDPADERAGLAVEGDAAQVDVVVGLLAGGQGHPAVHDRLGRTISSRRARSAAMSVTRLPYAVASGRGQRFGRRYGWRNTDRSPAAPGVARCSNQRWWWSGSGGGSGRGSGSWPSQTSMPARSIRPIGLPTTAAAGRRAGRAGAVEQDAGAAALGEHDEPREGVHVVAPQPGAGEQQVLQLGEQPAPTCGPSAQRAWRCAVSCQSAEAVRRRCRYSRSTSGSAPGTIVRW